MSARQRMEAGVTGVLLLLLVVGRQVLVLLLLLPPIVVRHNATVATFGFTYVDARYVLPLLLRIRVAHTTARVS
jgi:hypothetical protein